MKKVILFGVLIITILLSGCTYEGTISVTSIPSPATTAINEAATSSTETSMLPVLTDSPWVEPVPIYSENIQAFLDAGLPIRNDMSPILERYYYQYSYPERKDDNPNCIWFIGNTSVDLDGDGKNESIKIIGGEEDSNGDFYDITVDIDGKQIKLESDRNRITYTGDAQILDIDNKDGKKEVGIDGDYWGKQSGFIITYDGKTPKVILENRFETDDLDITGNGSIEIWKDEFYRELYTLKDDHSGFEKVDTQFYVPCCMYYYWQKYAPESDFNLVTVGTTEKTEKLAAKPGGKRNIPIAKGIEVYYGLYSKDGWIMVMNTDGNLLGWLPVGKALSLVPFYDNQADDIPWLPYLS